MLRKITYIIKNEIVLCVSLLLAIISMFLIPPNDGYISYIDWRTLAILLSMMIIMAGLMKLWLFQQIGEGLVARVTSLRGISIILILLCFGFSMLITNDVSLLTFVPFSIVVLNLTGCQDALIPVIILETVAANLGSMLLPMGNPQNLYLYSLSGMSFSDFVLLMLPYALTSLILILVLDLLLVKNNKIKAPAAHNFKRNKKEKIKLAIYLALFVLSLLVVLHILDYRIGFAIVVILVLIMDRKTLMHVDYSLIFTFIFLFIFIGNLKQIPAVSSALGSLLGGHEIIVAALSSQVISNVPAAILLSGFTSDIRGLIIGTNLGGLGTLIASMASLISFKLYSVTNDSNRGRYIGLFTVINVGMLVTLLIEAMLIG